MAFRNREDAARQLAGRLAAYRGLRPAVLALPRGAVPMARIVADALGGDLDIVLVCKIGAPDNPATAIGAVDETGSVTLTDYGRRHVPDQYVRAQAMRQLQALRHRRQLYTPPREAAGLANRIVIIVDDGIATGASMLAAVRAVRRQHPEKIVVAIPVAAPAALVPLRAEADEIVCLLEPVPLAAISGFYKDFSPVTDDEVVEILARPTLSVPSPPS